MLRNQTKNQKHTGSGAHWHEWDKGSKRPACRPISSPISILQRAIFLTILTYSESTCIVTWWTTSRATAFSAYSQMCAKCIEVGTNVCASVQSAAAHTCNKTSLMCLHVQHAACVYANSYKHAHKHHTHTHPPTHPPTHVQIQQ